MKSFFDSFSNGEMTLIAALAGAALGGVIGGAVSFFTTRYVIKHGPNYEDQIDGLNEKFEAFHETVGSLARTQEEFRKLAAERDERENERYDEQVRQTVASRWRPEAKLVPTDEGTEHRNKLSLSAPEKFFIREVWLLSHTGAKVYEFQCRFVDPATEMMIYIPHMAINEVAESYPGYRQSERFHGGILYKIERAEGDPIVVERDLKFSGSVFWLSNSRWYHLSG